jgi:hypothetical protein
MSMEELLVSGGKEYIKRSTLSNIRYSWRR